jgi:hypothetical protein
MMGGAPPLSMGAPPPMMGGGMADMVSMMAMKRAMEPSTDKIRRAMKILDDARKSDEKVSGIVSNALDILRNGPGGGTRERANNSNRPATSMEL